jgi:hypothetical protein
MMKKMKIKRMKMWEMWRGEWKRRQRGKGTPEQDVACWDVDFAEDS